MKIDYHFPERVRKVSENHFLIIYDLNVDFFVIIDDPSLKDLIFIDSIAVEGTVSLIFDIFPGLEKHVHIKTPVFCHKVKSKNLNKNLRHSSLE